VTAVEGRGDAGEPNVNIYFVGPLGQDRPALLLNDVHVIPFPTHLHFATIIDIRISPLIRN